MKKLILYLLFFPFYLFAQKYDNHWIANYPFIPGPSLHFDFSTSPPTITDETVTLPINWANVTMSDYDGNLLFYTNGIRVMNTANEMMENGDSLNWNDFTEFTNAEDGALFSLSFMGLPAPGSDSLYYLICNVLDYDTVTIFLDAAKSIMYSKIDVTANNGQGKVVEKNKLIGYAKASASFGNACRHGNGRDWWYLSGEDTASFYYRTLLTPDGFSSLEAQEIGYQPPFYLYYSDGGGQDVFSPDGTKYVDFDPWNGVRIYDFDRCTGLLGNPALITFPEKLGWGLGAAISPNSRFLYVDSDTLVFQFDLWASDIAASIDTVAVWDGFYGPNPTGFFFMQLMPDGKIYSLTGTNPYYHYIANPDVKGDGCNVVQHEMELPSKLFSIPTFPNYRLYDLPNSPCDTLGIDGPPVAVKELELPAGDIVLSPNPASCSLNINSVNCPWQPREVAIYDALGREVLRRAHPATVRSFTLALPELADGVYFCRLGDEKGHWKTLSLAIVGNR